GNNITRVLYFFFTGKHIVFTNGFIKKSQETPITEIERAKRYRDEFLNRKENRK
ncbi:MAG: type II toxin-antitoxin system RelE/ParE family toxin, partial [Oscillospiraceae bacterium]|nr:type II toxin-antitoxin system RelE/ParE family toxin [Oscillospiraceae bacterium]